MFADIFPGVFGAVLLICLCHCARLNNQIGLESGGDNGTIAESNATLGNSSLSTKNREGSGRCLTSLKQWFMAKTGILSGNPDDVRFFLYSNSMDNKYAEEVKFGDVPSLRTTHFQPGVQLKIIIHGFTKSHVHDSVQLIKDAYLQRMAQTVRDGGPALNVILVDWEPLGKPNVEGEMESLFYRLAVSNVPVVGRRVGEFIQFLIENGVVESLRDVHIIGFSLGAHIAGNAGNALKEFNAGQAPSRVTGLDPAGPAFYEKLTFSSRHLHKTDGRFVDVIHSNMGALGTISTLGHADFYPNGGGPVQQRCEKEYEQVQAQKQSGEGSVWDSKILMLNSCSHNKAPQFFAMSILNPYIIACKCEDFRSFKNGCRCAETAVFGEYCDFRTRGKFYLDI